MNLAKLFQRKPKENFPGTKHIIEYAFTCGGIEYYQFSDVFNIPYERGLKAIVYFQEVRLNCTREFLEKHVEAVRNALTPTKAKPSIDVNTVYILNEQLAQRLSLPPDTELLYKLASVVFFDKNEKPETYEFSYGAKKIEHWKKSASITDFFLQKPIVELIPFLKDAGQNLETYHTMMQEVNKWHLDSLSGTSLTKPRTASNIKSASSQAATPQSSKGSPSTNTSSN